MLYGFFLMEWISPTFKGNSFEGPTPSSFYKLISFNSLSFPYIIILEFFICFYLAIYREIMKNETIPMMFMNKYVGE